MGNKMNIFIKYIAYLTLSCNVAFAAQRINLDEYSLSEKASIKQQLRCDPNHTLSLYQMTYDAIQVLDHHNIPYSAAFGTLLGSIRGGGILPHDDDVDLIIKKDDEHRLMALKKTFWTLGYDLFQDGSKIVGYKLYSRQHIKLTDGTKILPFIDLFSFMWDESSNHYILDAEKGREIFRNPILTYAELNEQMFVSFGAMKIKVPQEHEGFLSRFYGSNWNMSVVVTHKHSSSLTNQYQWTLQEDDRTPALPIGPLKERVKDYTLFGIIPAPLAANNASFWDDFYTKNSVSLTPSTFATFLIENGHIAPSSRLVDIACGNGRDSFFFQKNGIQAVGIDASSSAIQNNKRVALESDMNANLFMVVDINDQEKLSQYQDFDNFYARFFIHSISEQEQVKFMNFLKSVKSQAKLLLEFRTDKDPMFKKSLNVGAQEGVTDHYRRYLNFETFIQSLGTYGFKVVYQHEDQGLSVHGEDNPFLGRVVAVKD